MVYAGKMNNLKREYEATCFAAPQCDYVTWLERKVETFRDRMAEMTEHFSQLKEKSEPPGAFAANPEVPSPAETKP